MAFSDNVSNSMAEGQKAPSAIPSEHYIHHRAMQPPFPEGIEVMYVGMGCFWGAERVLWQQVGVWTTAVGYSGGKITNPTYEAVCSGETGHAEVVLVAYNTTKTTCQNILKAFWENHDPTQGMRQGNDRGTQYRSVIYTTTDEQLTLAREMKEQYQT